MSTLCRKSPNKKHKWVKKTKGDGEVCSLCKVPFPCPEKCRHVDCGVARKGESVMGTIIDLAELFGIEPNPGSSFKVRLVEPE